MFLKELVGTFKVHEQDSQKPPFTLQQDEGTKREKFFGSQQSKEHEDIIVQRTSLKKFVHSS